MSHWPPRRVDDPHPVTNRWPLYGWSEWRDCFGDEIAIDFPSVAAVVDRMRDAFLGLDAASEAWRAEVQLSPREAFDGAVVPLQIPVRLTCRLCGGRGETWGDCCPECEGTGARDCRHHIRLTLPRGMTDGLRLRFSVTPPHAVPTRVEVRIAIR